MGCGCKNAESCGCSTMNAEGHKTVQCDFCSEKKPLGQMRRMPYDPEQGDLGKRVRYSGYKSTYAICDGCYRDRIKGTPVGKSVLHAEEKYDCGCINHGDDDNVGCESCGYESCLDCHHIDSTDRNVDNWKCYEGYGCNKGMNAEEPTVQEPDFLPNGDGRIIGQQDFAMNLTPLHAETFESHGEPCPECEDGTMYSKCDDCGFEYGAESFNAEESWGFVVVDGNGLRTDAFRTKAQARFYAQKSRDEAGRKGLRVVKAKESDDRMNKAQMDIIFGKGWDAESFNAEDSPSPNFNEGITGQDGPSASPTNANFSAEDMECMACGRWEAAQKMDIKTTTTAICHNCVGKNSHDAESASPTNQEFEAGMRVIPPNSRDIDTARKQIKAKGYGVVIYDRYLVSNMPSKKTGIPANKFYYTAIAEKDGRYYPLGAWGRVGYLNTIKSYNSMGKTENAQAFVTDASQAYAHVKENEVKKMKRGYEDSQLTSWGKSAETLGEIEGPTAEATAGGLHSPSSFDMTWEDGSGLSSASIPPNEIAWAEGSKTSSLVKYGSMGILAYLGYTLYKGNKVFNAVSNRKSCCGKSKSAETKTVRKNSEYSVGQINPVEVEGQSDVHGAEEVKLSTPHQGPQSTHYSNERPSQKMW